MRKKPKKPQRQPLTFGMKDIIDRMKAGEALCFEHTKDGPNYFFAGGKPAHRSSVEALRRRGMLLANDDGMFGDHQTFSLVHGVGNERP